MSLFDDMAKGAMGALGGDKGGNLASVASQLLTQEGGLQGLVQKFEQAGMGDVIKGWISPLAPIPQSPPTSCRRFWARTP